MYMHRRFAMVKFLWEKVNVCNYYWTSFYAHNCWVTVFPAEPEGSHANDTASDAESTKKSKKKEEEKVPASRTVKVNLTAEITTLDLPSLTSVDVELSSTK